jgi:uncharacterized protein (UPF0128 family)
MIIIEFPGYLLVFFGLIYKKGSNNLRVKYLFETVQLYNRDINNKAR